MLSIEQINLIDAILEEKIREIEKISLTITGNNRRLIHLQKKIEKICV